MAILYNIKSNRPFMFISTLKKHLLTLSLILSSCYSFGQTKPGLLQKTVADLENYSRLEPTEKIYLHFDKPYYSPRDTITKSNTLIQS